MEIQTLFQGFVLDFWIHTFIVAGYWLRSNCDHLASSLSGPSLRPAHESQFVSGDNPSPSLALNPRLMHSNHAVISHRITKSMCCLW
jgi:hypothetical protein